MRQVRDYVIVNGRICIVPLPVGHEKVECFFVRMTAGGRQKETHQAQPNTKHVIKHTEQRFHFTQNLIDTFNRKILFDGAYEMAHIGGMRRWWHVTQEIVGLEIVAMQQVPEWPPWHLEVRIKRILRFEQITHVLRNFGLHSRLSILIHQNIEQNQHELLFFCESELKMADEGVSEEETERAEQESGELIGLCGFLLDSSQLSEDLLLVHHLFLFERSMQELRE
mmetsp:Transcript_4954/g.18635  ORF Transcript_4954/g.18635 Transcript_4954/m.18635 type:complete len:224 (+) Transcript_4954:4903-5574(+)